MQNVARALIAILIVGSSWSTAGATPASAQPMAALGQCAANQAPLFVGETARLRDWIGTVMGDPISCPYVDLWSGDNQQLTTTGLVYSHQNSINLTFTTASDSNQAHWTMRESQLLYWEGQTIDRAGYVAEVSGCKAALTAYHTTGGDHRSVFVWAGEVRVLGMLGSSSVVIACVGAGSFPEGNRVWCLLARNRQAPIDRESCAVFASLGTVDGQTLVGTMHIDSVFDYVRQYQLYDTEFYSFEQFQACRNSPARRVSRAIAEDPALLTAYCHDA